MVDEGIGEGWFEIISLKFALLGPGLPELAAKVLDLAAGDPDLDVKVPLHYCIYGTTLFFPVQNPPKPHLIPCWNKKFSVFF